MKKGTVILDIHNYELQMNGKKIIRNTYAHKKTGEIVKIDYRKGKFRVI